MKTLIRIPLWPAACLTCVCKLEHIHSFTHHTFNNLTSLIFACGLRADDEKTFCRALVEYTRACSHVGYPVREWRDSFPSCGTITVELLLLMKAVILSLVMCMCVKRRCLSLHVRADDGCEDTFVHRDCISCCPPTCTFENECLGTNLHCLDGCYCPDGIQFSSFVLD